MAKFANSVLFLPAAGGTADFTVSSAVPGFMTPTLAGMSSGTYKYRAESSDLGQWEIGEGAYDSGTGVLTRATVLYNSSGTGAASGQSGAGSKINFSAPPNVGVVQLVEDTLGVDQANSWTAAQKAQVKTNIRVSGVTTQVFTSGSGTYNTPANCTRIEVELVGGGGGGAGAGSAPGNGGAGGDTTFGTLAGGGGAGATNAAGGNGGTASGGFINDTGSRGQSASGVANTAGGNGGLSTLGRAGWGGAPGGGTGVAAAANSGSGGGGGGCWTTPNGGGGGGSGGSVRAIINNPSATYSYAVGAGGSAGTAGGGSGGAGAAGGSGVIVVREYYD